MQVQSNPVQVSSEKPIISQKKEARPDKNSSAGEKNPAVINNGIKPAEKKGEENTNIYLKVISRLENRLTKNKLSDQALESFTKAVKTRLDELNEQEKNLISNLPETKALEIKELDKLPDIIQEGLKDKEKAANVMKLLKHQKFAEIMGHKPKQAQTYSPPNGQNTANGTVNNAVNQNNTIPKNIVSNPNHKQVLVKKSGAQNATQAAAAFKNAQTLSNTSQQIRSA